MEIFRRQPTQDELLLEDIRDTVRRLNAANKRFQQETDSDLISSYIYEIKALKARYSFLLKRAKQADLRSGITLGSYERMDTQ